MASKRRRASSCSSWVMQDHGQEDSITLAVSGPAANSLAPGIVPTTRREGGLISRIVDQAAEVVRMLRARENLSNKQRPRGSSPNVFPTRTIADQSSVLHSE